LTVAAIDATVSTGAAAYVSNGGQINARLVPLAQSGNGPAPAEVDVDYVEIAVDYAE